MGNALSFARVLLLTCVTVLLIISCGDKGPTSVVDPPDDASAPSAPNLVSPSNSASNLPSVITLRWAEVDEAEAYNLQVSKSSDFSNFVLKNNI